MNVTAVLVDDEHKALAILKNKLERFCPNVKIIKETQQPKEAITIIKELKPDLVFLDIAMPELNGFDILKHFEQPDFEIIFATAFDNYAIKAIKHCAIGYLVKPVDNADLVEAVNNAVQNIEDKTALQKNKQLVENLGAEIVTNKKIIIPSTDGLEFVKIEEIIHCEGDSGYTKIHILNRPPILSSNSIGHFHKMLDSKLFYLVHKSHLINLAFIEKYLNEGYLILQNQSKIPVSRNKRTDFLNSLKR